MTIEQLMDIAKSNRLLPEDQQADFEKRYNELQSKKIDQGFMKIDQDLLHSDLYYKLAINSKVNTGNPPQKVAIPYGFWTLDCEVTQKMWFAVMPNSPANNAIRSLNNAENSPVRNVSWLDAQEFCKALSQKLNENVELLSEEQWEYACRAGGEDSSETCVQQAVSYEDYLTTPAIARSKSPNAWGIYDMPGNVKEWRSNKFEPLDESQKFAENAPLDKTSQQTIAFTRGGSYLEQLNRADFCSIRDRYPVDSRDIKVGFRICVEKK